MNPTRNQNRRTPPWLAALAIVMMALALVGCDSLEGDPGATGASGPAGEDGVPGEDGAPGDTGDPGVPIPGPLPTALSSTIESATIQSKPKVNFSLKDENGNPFAFLPASAIRFTIAKLVEYSDGEPSRWQSYVNRLETVDADGPGTPGETAIQATSESGPSGTLTNHNDGSYTYEFATNVASVTSPLAVSYEAGLTHRIAFQISGSGLPANNNAHDFRPSDGATTGIYTRNIVKTESCNECHGELRLHGSRTEVKYCVTCHNPGSSDANTGNPVDFKVLIHKIHRGKNLPSVASVGAPGVYEIVGFRDSIHDYSKLGYPQDIRGCTKCHDEADADTPDAANWKTVQSAEACGACHDNKDFSGRSTLAAWEADHSGGNPMPNTLCRYCHTDGVGGLVKSVADAHAIPGRIEAVENFSFNIVSITNTAPTQNPVVTFSVADPGNGNAPYDINADAEFTTRSVASLSVLIGWDTADYSNTGSLSRPSSPVRINAVVAGWEPNRAYTGGTVIVPATPTAPRRAFQVSIAGTSGATEPVWDTVLGNPTADGTVTWTAMDPAVVLPAVDNLDGTFTVTSAVAVPAAATGSLVVGIEGHPAAQDEAGVYTVRVPVKSVVDYAPITDVTAVARRTVVDGAKCNNCHARLSLHGSNRNDNPQICVICHNANNTDINRRPATAFNEAVVPGAVTPDGKKEQSIDFKVMIHAIHGAAKRENPIVVYGFGGSVHNFNTDEVHYPNSLNNCEACHDGDTYTLPLAMSVLPTTVDTAPAFTTVTDVMTDGVDVLDPSVDLNTTATAAVCSSCHDTFLAQLHMDQNGGEWNMLDSQANTSGANSEACAICHGDGRLADVKLMHGILQ